jgi:hypothetical protein
VQWGSVNSAEGLTIGLPLKIQEVHCLFPKISVFSACTECLGHSYMHSTRRHGKRAFVIISGHLVEIPFKRLDELTVI